ncbi:DEAD/DEAH box helicase [Nocardioides pacificus]
MHPLLLLLDDAALGVTFGATTLQRARAYVREGNVRQVDVVEDVPHEILIEAEVAGSRGVVYDVGVIVMRSRGRVLAHGDCSCPVVVNCKHAAAAVIALRGRPASARHLHAVPGWGAQLEAVLDELESSQAVADKPLALQFELRPARSGHAPGIRMRPLQRGARERWIKSGMGWGEVARARYLSGYDKSQVEVLAELARAVQGDAYYYPSNAQPELADFGPALWLLLRRARETGVAFVGAGTIGSVELSDDPVRVLADVVDAADGTRLQVGARHGERWWPAGSVVPVGGHGLALLGAGTGLTGRSRDLVLAPAERFLPDSVRRLLTNVDAVVVPPAERDRLTSDYLPRLGHHLDVVSSDGSVAVPEDHPPVLTLTVTWEGAFRVGLAWGWRYQLGDERHDFALDSDDGLRVVRRVRAEREHLDRLRAAWKGWDVGAEELLAGPEGDPTPRRELADVEVLTFLDAVLPALRSDPLVEVLEEGTEPEHREADGDLDIRFDLVAGEGAGEGAGPTDWLDLSVAITIDGETVPLADVLAALTLGQERIFLPSGTHLAADHPELTRLGELVRAASELVEQDGDGVRVGRHDLGLWGELAELGIVDAQAAQWVASAQALRDLAGLPEIEPKGIVSDLRGYQLEGFRWLAFLWQSGLGGILADDMGLGKTLQTLALISHARIEGAGPFLVVAPTSVVSGWAHEAARHAPGLDVRTVASSARKRGTGLADTVAGADVVVTSYTLLRLEAEEYAALPWGGLVLDEAHQVKNHQGKTYQAVRRLDVPFRLALTGTPFENRLMELWSLLSIVAPGLYPWPKKFTEHVVVPVEKQGDQAALARFQRRIRPFLLRRTKELVASDLPPKQEQVLEVTLSARHRNVYETHLQRERQAVLGLVEDFDRNRVAIFRSLTKLRQLSLDAALVDEAHEGLGSAKLDVLVEHLVELVAEGHRALVFSQFTTFLRRVRERLSVEGIDTVYLDGRTRDRGQVIADFQSGQTPVFLISLKAGGVGLTLTEADYVFVLDPWWNPAAEAQAVDRAHRIGQLRPVMVYRLVATDTIEEKVMALKERKAALFSQVLDGGAAMTAGIDADDVRELFGD